MNETSRAFAKSQFAAWFTPERPLVNGNAERVSLNTAVGRESDELVAGLAIDCGSGVEMASRTSNDRTALAAHGIETLRLYGPRAKSGSYYDPKALAQALEALVGRADPRSDKYRRNTLVG